MRRIHLAAVGDGLSMRIDTMARNTIQIDCGSQQVSDALPNSLYYFRFPSVITKSFILTHFHTDHYNGLLYYFRKGKPFEPSDRIRKVYYPRLPEFKEKTTFLKCLFAINARVFGSTTGIMEYDFLRTIYGINNNKPFEHRSLSEGQNIQLDGLNLEILWPPKILRTGQALSLVRKAIDSFDAAKERDQKLQYLYDIVSEEGLYDSYLNEEAEPFIYQNRENLSKRKRHEQIVEKRLPRIVDEANRALRRAANHLCICFMEGNRLLFLGDIEGFEIKRIVEKLVENGRTNFHILITPHHGTHWHHSLSSLRVIKVITSNGKKLVSKMNERYRDIDSYSTFLNGDITLFDSVLSLRDEFDPLDHFLSRSYYKNL